MGARYYKRPRNKHGQLVRDNYSRMIKSSENKLKNLGLSDEELKISLSDPYEWESMFK